MKSITNLSSKNIIFMLLQCASYMYADCVTRGYKGFPAGFNLITVNGAFDVVNLTDIAKCGQLCADEVFCKTWRFSYGKCKIFNSMQDKVQTLQLKTTRTRTFYETEQDEKWTKIFFVKNGSGFKVAASFLGRGKYETWGPKSCTLNHCPDLFRSTLIDVWDDLPIKEVKLSFIKNNKEARYLIFDGRKTTSSSWFAMSRVLKSPWKDIHKGAIKGYLSLDSKSLRKFYASKLNDSCKTDQGWIAVFEKKWACFWEDHPIYPQIIYSNKDSATTWSKEYAVADALAVYISF